MKKQQALIQQLKSYLKKRPEVILAFLFGSLSKNQVGKLSDVDIGIFFKPELKWPEVSALWGDLEEIASRQVDLVILNQASPTLAWSVIRGKPLVIKDFQFYLNFLLKVSQEAEDYREFLFDFWRWRQRCQKVS